jgi:hypothetical protein
MNPKFSKIFSHPNFESLQEHVWVIHDFTSKEEQEYYLKIAETAKEEEWWTREPGWWRGKFLPLPRNEETDLIVNGVLDKLKGLVDDPDQWTWGSPMSVHRQQVGQSMFLHSDNPEGIMEINNWVEISFVMYHSDFNGGEIVYPELDFVYKPVKGDLLIHPGTENYLHGTKPVLEGPVRYNSTAWAYDKRVDKLKKENKVYEGSNQTDPLDALLNGKQPNDYVSLNENHSLNEDLQKKHDYYKQKYNILGI